MSQTDESRNFDYPVDHEFDPLDPAYLADPYPYYARFRREAPVFYAPKIDFWVVSRYADIREIVKDPGTFSNARVQDPLYSLTPEAFEKLKKGVRVTPTTSTTDPPLHRRTRKHAARAFSARRVTSLEPRIREIANGLIDEMISDVVNRFAFPLPASVVFSLIGYPEEDTEMLKSWCFDRLKLTWGRPLPEEQLATVEKMTSFLEYIENFVYGRAEDLRDDYTSDLLRIRAEDENDLSLEEVISIDYSLSFAGHETTTNLILNSLRQLLGGRGCGTNCEKTPPWSRTPSKRSCGATPRSSPGAARRPARSRSPGSRSPKTRGSCFSSPRPTATKKSSKTPTSSISAARTPRNISFQPRHPLLPRRSARPPRSPHRVRVTDAKAPRPAALSRPAVRVRPEHLFPWPEAAVGGMDAGRDSGRHMIKKGRGKLRLAVYHTVSVLSRSEQMCEGAGRRPGLVAGRSV